MLAAVACELFFPHSTKWYRRGLRSTAVGYGDQAAPLSVTDIWQASGAWHHHLVMGMMDLLFEQRHRCGCSSDVGVIFTGVSTVVIFECGIPLTLCFSRGLRPYVTRLLIKRPIQQLKVERKHA